jgi:hypothetical protein
MMVRLAVLIAAAWLAGCTTMRSAAPPAPGALEYRETQAEIRQQQTEIAVAGSRIEDSGRGIVDGLEALETALEAPEIDRGQVISQVREVRIIAEDHQAEIENLNLMLAQERDATRRQGEIFDQREEAWQRALSDREAENAALRVENKAVKGQRNTLLAILITAGGLVVLFIVARALRRAKIILP